MVRTSLDTLDDVIEASSLPKLQLVSGSSLAVAS